MADLPTATITILFTDIESSTALLQKLGDHRYAQVLEEHQRLLRAAFREGGAHKINTQGDGFFVVFKSARHAVATAVAAQRALFAHPWPEDAQVRVRMGLHTDEPITASGGYIGLGINRAARICSSAYGGQILLSQTTRDIIENDLPPGVDLWELGEYRLRDLHRPTRIFQVRHPEIPAVFPPLKSLDARPNNLPIQLTSFIGREREIAEVKHLLSQTRLLTLAGIGGAGKTRLALQVAADQLDQFTDGVWFVDLASTTDRHLLAQTVAVALGAREQSGQPILGTLTEYLKARRLLLVLDNCEHLITACATFVHTLLSASPHLRILATSREALRVPGEVILRVPPLSVPGLDGLPPLHAIGQYEAIRLFVERARLYQPGFTLTEQNASLVAQICHRLDGMPLAIELAAARVNVLAVEQMAERFKDAMRWLTAGTRTAPNRQRTLRAAVDWSYDLLTESERVLFNRLAIFAGGFTLEAVEAVCCGNGLEASDVLDLLSHLVDKSLVAVEADPSDSFRYRLLEVLRRYSWERLQESGEAETVRRSHGSYFLKLAEEAEPGLRSTHQASWFRRLEQEHDNCRAALRWSMESGEEEISLRLTGALWWFWYVRGYVREGREWLEKALAESGEAPASARAKSICAAGLLALRQSDYGRATQLAGESAVLCRTLGDTPGLAFSLGILGLVADHQGNYERAATLSSESLGLARRVEDKWGTAFSQNTLGIVARIRGDYERARALGEESLALCQELGDEWGIAGVLNSLGLVARDQGDYERAGALLEESLTLSRKIGDGQDIAFSQNSLGVLARLRGDYGRATALHEESLALCRALGDTWGIAYALHGLGLVARDQGEYDRAGALCAESLLLRREVGDRRGIALSLTGLAIVAVAHGQPQRAARLFGAAEALRESIGMPHPPFDRADHDRSVASVRAELGDAVFTSAWAEGREMALDEAINSALARPAHQLSQAEPVRGFGTSLS